MCAVANAHWNAAEAAPNSTRDKSTESLLESGDAALKAGKLSQAEWYYKNAEAKYYAVKCKNIDQLADIITMLSRAYRQERKYELAITYATKLIDVEKIKYGAQSIFIAEDYKTLGDIQREAKRNSDAETSFRQAIKLGLPAEAIEYNRCVIARASNEAKKYALIYDSYKALIECLEQDGDVPGVEDVYKQAIDTSPAIADMNVYWLRKTFAENYVQFLERNDLDSSVAKEKLIAMKRQHDANHEYRPGELPSD